MAGVWHPFGHPAFLNPLCLLDATTVDWSLPEGAVRKVSFELNHLVHGMAHNGTRLADPGFQRYFSLFSSDGSLDSEKSLIVAPVHSPSHRWVFCPDQTPEEAWLFKHYDTRANVAPSCFHNSFRDPFHADDKAILSRQNVEFRFILTFPKKTDKKETSPPLADRTTAASRL